MANGGKKPNSKQDGRSAAFRMKRLKREKKAQKLKELRTDHFSRLPIELLATILCLTTTKDILAVARSSRHLCQMLVNFPSSNFIWRQARANSPAAPIPDPLPNLTESAYAALLFDPGVCEQCGTVLRTQLAPFALRLRVCDEGDIRGCMKDWLQQKGVITTSWPNVTHPFVGWLVSPACRGWLFCFMNIVFLTLNLYFYAKFSHCFRTVRSQRYIIKEVRKLDSNVLVNKLHSCRSVASQSSDRQKRLSKPPRLGG